MENNELLEYKPYSYIDISYTSMEGERYVEFKILFEGNPLISLSNLKEIVLVVDALNEAYTLGVSANISSGYNQYILNYTPYSEGTYCKFLNEAYKLGAIAQMRQP